MEELDRVKREKSSLLDQIEQLERTKLINTRKGSGTILAIFLYLLQDQSESFLQWKTHRYPTHQKPRNPQRTPRTYLKIRWAISVNETILLKKHNNATNLTNDMLTHKVLKITPPKRPKRLFSASKGLPQNKRANSVNQLPKMSAPVEPSIDQWAYLHNFMFKI